MLVRKTLPNCRAEEPRWSRPLPPKAPAATIFHEPWWLSAATDGAYEEAVVTSDAKVVGRLPYLRLRKIGWQTALVMPTLTHVLGPSISANPPGSESSRSLRRFKITRDLIAQLPEAGHIWFALHRGETDTLAFEAAGFSTAVDFTVDIPPDAPDVLWRGMRDKTRNVIRRAQEVLTVRTIAEPGPFLDFYAENLRNRSRQNTLDRRISGNVLAACLEHGRGRIRAALNAAGELQAAIFTVWDDEAEYYLMSTRKAESANGAISLLIWAALQEAASCGRIFDLDGIDAGTNHLLLTGFGGKTRARFLVSRTSTSFQIARTLKSTFARLPIFT